MKKIQTYVGVTPRIIYCIFCRYEYMFCSIFLCVPHLDWVDVTTTVVEYICMIWASKKKRALSFISLFFFFFNVFATAAANINLQFLDKRVMRRGGASPYIYLYRYNYNILLKISCAWYNIRVVRWFSNYFSRMLLPLCFSESKRFPTTGNKISIRPLVEKKVIENALLLI